VREREASLAAGYEDLDTGERVAPSEDDQYSEIGVDDGTADVPASGERSDPVPDTEPYFEKMVKYVRWYRGRF
jgi:hypothetical protein